MAFKWSNLIPTWRTEDKEDLKKSVSTEGVDTKPLKPSGGGRISEPQNGGFSIMDVLSEEMSELTPEFQIELLEAIEHLAKYNSDVSLAVDNVVQLSGTEYTVSFDDSVSTDQMKTMLAELKSIDKSWYAYSGGTASLRNDLFSQVILTGAISAEGVISSNFDGLERVVLVSPKNIRFKYDSKNSLYNPYQKLKGVLLSPIRDSKIENGNMLIPLNTLTYKYVAIRRFNESPYAIPPLLSALESVCIEKNMLANFRNIIDKFGVLGFMSVLLAKPKVLPGQSPEAYKAAAEVYINEASVEVDKGVSKGYVVGFKGEHEFDMKHTTANFQGAGELFLLNQEAKMAGLKQDPLMLGRNNSVTDAVGRVIMSKLSAQLQSYQLAVDSFLADMMLLHLKLKGYNLKYVQVESRKPLLMDEIKEHEAYAKKIENYDALYQQGVISQTARAQALGFDEADAAKPRGPVKPVGKTQEAPISKKDLPSDTGPTKRKKVQKKLTIFSEAV